MACTGSFIFDGVSRALSRLWAHEETLRKDGGIHRRLVTLVSKWSEHRSAPSVLFGVSAAEPVFLFMPPESLLWPMALRQRQRSLMFALLALGGCAIGTIVSYGIGMLFTGPASHFVGESRMAWAQFNIEEHGAMFLLVAGLAPIPYKFVVMSCGVLRVDPIIVFGMLLTGRLIRFGIPAAAIRLYGDQMLPVIRRYFTPLCIFLCLLLLLSLVASIIVPQRYV